MAQLIKIHIFYFHHLKVKRTNNMHVSQKLIDHQQSLTILLLMHCELLDAEINTKTAYFTSRLIGSCSYLTWWKKYEQIRGDLSIVCGKFY